MKQNMDGNDGIPAYLINLNLSQRNDKNCLYIMF